MQAHAVRLWWRMSDTTWLDSLPVSWPQGIRRQTSAGDETLSPYLDFVCSLTKQEKNGNMILYLSAFLHHIHSKTL